MRPNLLPFEPSEREIQRAAYFLWEARGRPAGHDFEIWLAARERLHRSTAAHRGHYLPRRAQRTARNAQPVRR